MAKGRNLAWGTLAGSAALAAFGVVGWRTSDLGRAASDLENQRAAARREGVPMEYADLRRLTPPVPDAENAAIPYGRAFEALALIRRPLGVDADRYIDAVAKGEAKPEELAQIRTILKTLAPALDDVREGSRLRACDFHRAWEKGAALAFPEYAFARSAGRALVLRALLAKTPQAAADDLRAAARLRAHLGNEPNVICALMGSSMEANVQKGVRALAARGGAWTAAMPPVLDALGPLPDLRRFLTGEAVFSRAVIDEIARDGGRGMTMEGQDSPAAFRLVRFKSVRDAFESRTIEHWRAVWAGLPPDPLDWRANLRALDAPIPQGPSYALLQITAPIFSGVGRLPAEMEAERRLTRVALDLWAGKAPVLTRDPFGGSLRLKRSGDRWTLWSRGPDAVDQDGKARTKKFSDSAYDLVVKSDGL